MANIQNFLKQSDVVFRYTENSLRGMVVEGIVGAASGLALTAVVDSTQQGVLYPGDPVSIVATSKGTPHMVKATDVSKIVGFVAYETKKTAYVANDLFNLASTGKVMQMVADNVQINAGDKLYCSLADAANIVVTNVQPEDGIVIGVAEESIAAPGEAGALIAVRITAPVALAI